MSLISQLQTKSFGFIITGFSLVVGLSWNEAIKQFINNYFPLTSDMLTAKIIYALILTLILVILVDYLERFEKKLIQISNESEKIEQQIRSRIL